MFIVGRKIDNETLNSIKQLCVLGEEQKCDAVTFFDVTKKGKKGKRPYQQISIFMKDNEIYVGIHADVFDEDEISIDVLCGGYLAGCQGDIEHFLEDFDTVTLEDENYEDETMTYLYKF